MVALTAGGRLPTPPFYTSIACWIDLLGYGEMISRAQFSPIHPEAKSAIGRLRRFHRIVAEHSSSRFPTLVINDGAVGYRDLDYLSNDRTLPFLQNALRLFERVNAERSDDQAGARMVIAAGFRMKGRRPGGAVHFDVVPQLQANFAFTAAYLAEGSGSDGGLPGANCYVDMSLFGQTSPAVRLGPSIPWHHKKLDLRRDFAPLLGIDALGNTNPADVRTGYEVACALAQEADVQIALRLYRVKLGVEGG